MREFNYQLKWFLRLPALVSKISKRKNKCAIFHKIVKVHYILVIFTLVQNEEKKERLKKKAKVGQNVGGKAMTGELEGGADLNICCRPPYCSEITPLQCAVCTLCRPYCCEIAPLQPEIQMLRAKA